MNTRSDEKKIEKRIENKNTAIIYLFLGILALVSIILHYKIQEPEWLNLAFSSLFDASIAALAVTGVIELITKKDNEKKYSRMIRAALIPEECPADEMPEIYDIYKKEELHKILKNTIKAYTGNDYLSDHYLSFIDSSYSDLRRDENYQVTLRGNNEDGKFHIRQQYKATYVYIAPKDVSFKAFFVLKKHKKDKSINRDLDRILNDKSYAFREEIEDEDFNETLKALCSENRYDEILDALKFKLSFFDKSGNENKVLRENIIVEPKKKIKTEADEANDYYGIEIRVPSYKDDFVFPDKSSNDKGRYYEKEGYVRSSMYLEIDYPVPDKMNNFYLIYPRPTISSRFTLTFEDIPGYRHDKVSFMPFLTYIKDGKDSWDGKVIADGNHFTLNAQGLILPRSGVSFSWNFRKSLSRIEQSMVDHNLVDIQSVNKDIDVKLVYSTADNFAGEDLYGGMEKAYLVPELAVMLSQAQDNLSARHQGMRLLVYDAARPNSVQAHMFNLVKDKYPNPEFYVSNPSKHGWHNYGLAVDVTIEDIDGIPLDMGTGFDSFGPESHIDKEDELVAQGALTAEQKANRELLRSIMTEVGFEPLKTEWWHFQKYSKFDRNKKFKLLNF